MEYVLWSICFAVFLVIELVIPSLVSVWFSIAALIMVFIAPFVKDLRVQTFIFACISFILLLSLRKVAKRYLKPKDSLRHEEVEIVNTLGADKGRRFYEVKYKGGIWSAIGKEDHNKGDILTIESFDGNKIILKD